MVFVFCAVWQFGVWVCPSCSDDQITHTTRPRPKDFTFYMGTVRRSCLFVFHPATQTRAMSKHVFSKQRVPQIREFQWFVIYHFSPFLMAVLEPKPVLISTPFWPWQDSANHVVLLCWILSCAFFPPQFTWRIRRGCPNKTIKTYGTFMIYVHKLEYSTCGI